MTKKIIESKFTFFKAGQGCFYGGRIFNIEKKKIYTIVYDCGTSKNVSGNTKSLSDEIAFFEKYPSFTKKARKVIDILFISHLDYDHVSGLKKLLMLFEVKLIVLPYLDDELKAITLASVSYTSQSDEDEELLSIEEYNLFIQDPASLLRNRNNDATIIYITDEDDGDENAQQSNIGVDDVVVTATSRNDIGTTGISEVLKNNAYIALDDHWEFIPHRLKVDDSKIRLFKTALRKKVKDFKTVSLKQLILNNRKFAHECYEKLIGEVNCHGLVLYHGPILIKNNTSTCSISVENNIVGFAYGKYYYTGNTENHVGTLLMGDTSINPKNNPIKFPVRISKKSETMAIIQIPHHGAKANWSSTRFSKFFNIPVEGEACCPMAVCNFGVGNRYGHPHPSIIDTLSINFLPNTQFNRVDVEINVCKEAASEVTS
ncbi:MBL fold metallo-hydrolase [Sphingobacterium bambusae]|uniref:MBL fold metallo-hydrolase n=1 Tax=Sphingobacterium bambusae TaxID=662858 RepID=A0ABW6BN24_9SPHI|nr:MBL fold metallo-hydrolase [Sphingobacterium bambusae]WPL47901.1 MBL fold metallo-hydrolase [Sphingobacterium bambusae]